MWDEKAKNWRARKKAGRAGSPQRAADPQAASPEGPAADEVSWRDPEPAHMAQAARPPAVAWDPSKVSRETKDEIAGMLGLFYSVPADFLIAADPYCFGALNANLDATIDATVPIICRSKMAVEFVSGASGLILWIKLLATLKPFLVAIWQHHVTGTVALVKETDEKTGKHTGRVIAEHADLSAYTIVREAA